MYLIGTPYAVWGGLLWCIANENKPTRISNFIVFARKKITYTNGVDTTIKYQLEGHLLGNPSLKLPPLTVDLDAYSSMKFLDGSAWEKYARIFPGRTNAEKVKEVMQIINTETMVETTVYTNTGFEKIGDDLCYLYHRWNNRQC